MPREIHDGKRERAGRLGLDRWAVGELRGSDASDGVLHVEISEHWLTRSPERGGS